MNTTNKVFVYYNLHKHCWSVKALDGESKGRVIAHRNEVVLRNPVGRVSEAGRQRVLLEKRKNVHAGIVGEWRPDANILLWEGDEITYNPYRFTQFVYADNHSPFTGASLALMSNRQVLVI